MPLNEMQRRSLEWCREQLKSNVRQLEEFETEKVRIGENRGSGWIDTTQSHIAELKERSAGLESIIATHQLLSL